MKWRSYQQARKFARALKLKNRDGWDQYCKTNKKPDDIRKVYFDLNKEIRA